MSNGHSFNNISQGIEGTHITYHPDSSPEDDDPLQGIRFVVSLSLGTWSQVVGMRSQPTPRSRSIPSRFGGTCSPSSNILHRYHVFHRNAQSFRVRSS
jgi:hypothetical protein